MFPACRTAGNGFAIPPFALTPGDGAGFVDALQAFQGLLHDGFPRSAPRAHCFDYLVGQLRPLERKSIEPIALQVPGGNVRGLQRLLREVVWDEEQLRWHSPQIVAEARGAPAGVLMVAETGCVQKGTDSVGVARPSCGPLGKVEHCQVGVCASEASRQGDALVDQRLFRPEAWVTDPSAARRRKGNVPPEWTFPSKPQLAATMVQAIAQEGLLPLTYLVADCLSGPSPDFLDALDACVGVTAFVALPADTRCWPQAPRTTHKTYT